MKKLFFDNDDITNPKGSNNLKAYGSFYFRDVYDCYVFPDARADLWYNTQFKFFGRINDKKRMVIVSEKDLKQLPNQQKTVLALPPVVESWRGMTEYIKRSILRGDVDPEESFVSELIPQRGWISPHRSYANYNSSLYNAFSGEFMTSVRDRKFKDFESFVELFIDFFLKVGYTVPVTREGFMLSKYSDPCYSGMCIQIAEDNQGEDKIKGKYLSDKNFEYFKNVARRYGFVLDKNAPWRLIPDLNSRGMQRSMKKVGTSAETFYKDYFVEGYKWELQNFKYFLWGWYDGYVSANPYIQVIDLDDDSDEPTLLERKKYTEKQLFESYSDHYFIKLYAYIRAIETRKNWTQGTFDRVVGRSREILHYQGLNRAMLYLHENIDPCSEKMGTEIFNQKDLTKKQLSVILRKRDESNKNPFRYY